MGHKFPMVPSRRLLNAGPLVVAGVFSDRGSQNGVIMIRTVRTAAATALFGMAALSLSTSANAGDGKAVGAGLLGFGVGAIVGSAITPRCTPLMLSG